MRDARNPEQAIQPARPQSGRFARGHRRRASTGRVAVAALVALGVLVTAPVSSAQVAADAAAFVSVFDDPTSLAIEIDTRVASVIGECMTEKEQQYVVSTDARFNISELTLEAALDPALERSFGDLVPQLATAAELDLGAGATRFDRFSLRTDVLIEPDQLDIAVVPRLLESEALFTSRNTDVDLRLFPLSEGYAVAWSGYELLEPDPNLAIVETLSAPQLELYEEAFYGKPLANLAEDETGGCAELGVDVLLEEIIPELVARDAELAALEQKILADPGFTNALVEWRQCVSSSGVAGSEGLQTLDDAVALTTERFTAAGTDARRLNEARQFERDLATADFDCRARSTDLAIAAVVAREGLPYVNGIESLTAQLRERTP